MACNNALHIYLILVLSIAFFFKFYLKDYKVTDFQKRAARKLRLKKDNKLQQKTNNKFTMHPFRRNND